jgi:hypothetical protein
MFLEENYFTILTEIIIAEQIMKIEIPPQYKMEHLHKRNI